MPTISFSIVTPLDPEKAWEYLRDLKNMGEWDEGMRIACIGEQEWGVSLKKWPSCGMHYTRNEETPSWSGKVSHFLYIFCIVYF